MEAHWHTNPSDTGASFSVIAWPDPEKQDNRWSVEIPILLSILTSHSTIGQIKGLREYPREDQPPVALTYYAFRAMVAIGTALFILMLWTIRVWRRGGLDAAGVSSQKWLLRAWMAAIPLSYLAMETGWMTREVGRQPWVIHGLLRTGDSASRIPAETVAASLAAFALVYLFLLILFFVFAGNIIARGPEAAQGAITGGNEYSGKEKKNGLA